MLSHAARYSATQNGNQCFCSHTLPSPNVPDTSPPTVDPANGARNACPRDPELRAARIPVRPTPQVVRRLSTLLLRAHRLRGGVRGQCLRDVRRIMAQHGLPRLPLVRRHVFGRAPATCHGPRRPAMHCTARHGMSCTTAPEVQRECMRTREPPLKTEHVLRIRVSRVWRRVYMIAGSMTPHSVRSPELGTAWGFPFVGVLLGCGFLYVAVGFVYNIRVSPSPPPYA